MEMISSFGGDKFNLSMLAVAQALVLFIDDCIEKSNLIFCQEEQTSVILGLSSVIANEWCIIV